MRLAFVCIAAIGCTDPMVRVEPAAIDLDVDLAQPAPSVTLRVFADEREVTERATFALSGAPIGTLVGAQLTSDGVTGGAAEIAVTIDGVTTVAPVRAFVHETRFVTGAPSEAATWLAMGQEIAVAQPLEPGDGATLPPDLGKLDIDFGAVDTDTVHEIAVVAPFLDLRVYAPGAPGPRHVDLDTREWRAIANTARGGSVILDARSVASGGGAPVHVMSAHLEIADLDASSLVFGGVAVDTAGTMTGRPQLFRYDMAHATVEPFANQPADGSGCIGCHIAASRDGSKLVGAGFATSAGGTIVGMLIDTRTRGVTIGDAWNTGTFDPSGALVTSLTATGELTLRDGTTGAAIKTLALGEPAAGPTISPDGRFLAYEVMAMPEANNPAGTALRVRPWNAADGTVGPAITVATEAGVLAPEFSSDGAWLLYTRSMEPNERAIVGGSIVRADGSAPAIPLTTGAGDQLPRWASPVTSARAGNRDAEPVAWIAFASSRAIGASPLPGAVKSLWLAAFYPERGVMTRPFHLPGQTRTLFALHSPIAMP